MYSGLLLAAACLSLGFIYFPISLNTWPAYILGAVVGYKLMALYAGEFKTAIVSLGWVRSFNIKKALIEKENSSHVGAVLVLPALMLVSWLFGIRGRDLFATFCVGMIPGIFLTATILTLQATAARKYRYLLVLGIFSLMLGLALFGGNRLANKPSKKEVEFSFMEKGKKVKLVFGKTITESKMGYAFSFDICQNDETKQFSYCWEKDKYLHKYRLIGGSTEFVVGIANETEMTMLIEPKGYVSSGDEVLHQKKCTKGQTKVNGINFLEISCQQTYEYEDKEIGTVKGVGRETTDCYFPLKDGLYFYYANELVSVGSTEDNCQKLREMGLEKVEERDER